MDEVLRNLIVKFSDSVIAQNFAIERHDPATGNELATSYIEAADTLINRGSEGIDAFAHLLKDERVAVRVMAASYLLPYRTDEALFQFCARLREGKTSLRSEP